MNIYRLFLGIAILLYSSLLSAQLSIKEIKSQAKELADNGQYYRALELYERVLEIRPTEALDLYTLGLCYFKTNQLDPAEKYFIQQLNQDKKTDALAYLYLAEIHHQKLLYKDAIRYYKHFLRKKGKNHVLGPYAIGQIKRCGSGRQWSHAEQLAYVENLGPTVNSIFDETSPLPSPNYADRIYFSSIREGNTGGPINDQGQREARDGNYRSDMFVAQLNQGAWSSPFPLNEDLNTERNEYLLGFRNNGRIVYFESFDDYSAEIRVDTFVDQPLEGGRLRTGVIDNMLGLSHKGGVQYYNDTIMIFASTTLKGFGGYDLYISKLRNDEWIKPSNLGPHINTPFDEVSPFLAKNGRRLYFSSNRETGIGGYDVFMTDFNDLSSKWIKPKNMLAPINSSADDIHFVLSEDGLRGWLASSRYQGFGGLDLYSCFFKSKIEEHLSISSPLTFVDVNKKNSNLVTSTGEIGSATSTNQDDVLFEPNEIKEFTVTPINYDENDFILSTANKKIIGKYISLLKSYPTIKILLTAHADGTDSQQFDHYFSIKRSEKLADYMISQGVPANRITIKGCGSQYPIALSYQNGKPYRMGQKINRRIDVTIIVEPNMPLKVTYADPEVSDRIGLPLGANYKKSNVGLKYRVELINTNQPFTGSSFLGNEYAAVEKDMSASTYTYMVGNYNTYILASNHRAEAMGQGLASAKVIPYFDGIRVSRDQLILISDQYPDLIYYLEDNP